jgi:hypothetical protein
MVKMTMAVDDVRRYLLFVFKVLLGGEEVVLVHLPNYVIFSHNLGMTEIRRSNFSFLVEFESLFVLPLVTLLPLSQTSSSTDVVYSICPEVR